MLAIKEIKTGDFVTFKASDGLYRIIFCIGVNKERSPHHFDFALTTLKSGIKPSLTDIRNSEFYGKGNRKDFRFEDTELEKMWRIHPEIKPYYLGTYGMLITRKALVSFKDKFELICNLPILENLGQNGNGGMNGSDFDILDDLFVKRLESFMKKQGQGKFRIESILKLE